MLSVPQPPAPAVLAAFGLQGPAARLAGGQGTSWRVSDVVLKPGVGPQFQEWLGTAVAGIEQEGFRLPTVLRARGGAWVVEGWGAQSVMPGSTVRDAGTNWTSIVSAWPGVARGDGRIGEARSLGPTHRPVGIGRPGRVGEVPRSVAPELRRIVERLDAVPPPAGRAQLVHGDLTSNILLNRDEPPSVIDFSPYWRAPSYAEGIVVADALCWHAASPGLLQRVGVSVEAVARGLLFRALSSSRLQRAGRDLAGEADRYRAVVSALNL